MHLNQFSRIFFRMTTAVYLLSSPLWAMETDEAPPPQVTRQSTQQNNIKQIKASDQLNFVKQCYDQYPGLTMRTPVRELWPFYSQDHQFIAQEISKRPNAAAMLDQLNAFDQSIQKTFSDEGLSFFDYTGISRGWAIILSDFPGEKNWKKFEDEWVNAKALDENQKKNNGIGQFPNLISAPGIFMPHVSPTGALPIPVINEGMAFVTEQKNLGTLTFLGVGTNERLSYDFLRNQNALDAWFHDFTHAACARRVRPQHTENFQNSIGCIHFLRQKIQEIADKNLRNQVELAFFMLFHEGTIKVNDTIKKEIDKKFFSLLHKIISTEDYMLLQYETWIQGAKSLKLDCPGEDIPARYRSFQDHLLKGYEFLLEHAETYDHYQATGTAISELLSPQA